MSLLLVCFALLAVVSVVLVIAANTLDKLNQDLGKELELAGRDNFELRQELRRKNEQIMRMGCND
jgi:glucose-6-phosphate-specific signal transduction histidine kinase